MMLKFWDKYTKQLSFFLWDQERQFIPPENLTGIEPPIPPTDCHTVEWNGIDGWDIIESDPQAVENYIRTIAAIERKELILKDENGDVRWRIIANEDGKLQIEVDPADQPHVGEWLLNGILGIPRLEDKELIISLNGDLQAISIEELKIMMEQ